jgi:hypothetical protein
LGGLQWLDAQLRETVRIRAFFLELSKIDHSSNSLSGHYFSRHEKGTQRETISYCPMPDLRRGSGGEV